MTIRDRLDAYLDREGLDAVWFARPNSFAWLTGGDNVISRESPIGVAAAGYDGDEITVVTNTIEAPRLDAEELGSPAFDADVTVESAPWYASTLEEAVADVSPRPAAADFDVEGFDSVDASALRQPLTNAQIERYDRLAGEVAEVVEDVARDASDDDTELAVTAELRRALEAKDIATPVVLVGGSERARRFRHYTPKDVELGEYALLSVTAERAGQCVSCTRALAFDPPSWFEDRTRDAMRVEATALAATQAVGREGGTAADVFEAIQDAYADLGWEGEWEHHHQGGAAGYAGREWKATPGNDAPVELPMAFAWNPTVQGAKSEDLFLVSEGEIRQLSDTGAWPRCEVDAVGYDITLERSAPLGL